MTMARVLVADDDDDVRDCIQEVLETDHHEVVVVTNGADALLCAIETFQVIVADLRMPAMGGDELKRELDSRHLEVPLILVSSDPDAPLIAARIGAFGFLPKPFDQDVLLTAVTHAVATAARRRASRQSRR
jgi:DNA-binding NtrC family response regulator